MAAQQPDLIVIDGKMLNLNTNPLELYWNKTSRRRPEFCSQPYCERGYIATWEIQSKKLFLINIDGYFQKRSFLAGKQIIQYTMQTLFPDYAGERVLANWFNGKLRIPSGSMRRFVNKGYDSRFEREILMSVEEGNITKEVILDFTNQSLVIHK